MSTIRDMDLRGPSQADIQRALFKTRGGNRTIDDALVFTIEGTQWTLRLYMDDMKKVGPRTQLIVSELLQSMRWIAQYDPKTTRLEILRRFVSYEELEGYVRDDWRGSRPPK